MPSPEFPPFPPPLPGLRFRQAEACEAGVVSSLLVAAAADLIDKGQALWNPADLGEGAVAADVAAGMFHLALLDDVVVGVFCLQLEDRVFWPEIAPGTSAFLHKVAVLPGQQGMGLAQQLLQHACTLARERGLRFLRLDCRSGRPKLRGVYERFGFRFHSRKMFGESGFDRMEVEVERRS
jgi:GNAT superfamily N-acetyltransferase